ncbi:hypothetical protein SAMN02745135_01862 [Caloranaerobacter azorensis DSM 13643]|uniref:Uncharacterized protein n=1 Tax=Caloranaerobacter azorensis DSM 13643 TaxID=1121264 RepID=A0A1M5VCH0_9FIRM|nr:hypothetical protein [Caloranaerobacter azorensis]SHH72848.1 hypothetical protein SAMN02745135_01862 [Caloranaerobacter azorensis DSM 13643]
MKVNKKVTWSLILTLIITLAIGAIALADTWQYFRFRGTMNGYRYSNGYEHMWNNGYNGMSDMMTVSNVSFNNVNNINEKMTLNEIKQNINNYLKNYDENLEIGYIYPEPGPNMMWNEKYGMHSRFGFGMMGLFP